MRFRIGSMMRLAVVLRWSRMRIQFLVCFLFLSACGIADVGTATVTTAKLQADQAKQGKETLDKMQPDLEAAREAEEQRLRQFDSSNNK